MERRCVCPLLKDPANYDPDTIDLLNDPVERGYWFECLREMVRKFIKRAGILNPDYPQATEVAEKCFRSFDELIERLENDLSALNPISIRTLLDFNERTLRENNFKDAWFNQKSRETAIALSEFPGRIQEIDQISEPSAKWFEVARGVLAGNMFDWGAKAVTDILELSENFGLQQAKETIQMRPWFKDNLNQWIARIQNKPFKKAVIFVDNAGVDFILGMLPFARELLKSNTKVILSSNTNPALNDITHQELLQCLHLASNDCHVIRNCLSSGQLSAVENGQGGPCLDLRNLNEGLCKSIEEADLIVLEGMGRAIHTNFKAEFKVDSLKMAVLKNEWLARSLGAEQFSVVFEYVCVNK